MTTQMQHAPGLLTQAEGANHITLNQADSSRPVRFSPREKRLIDALKTTPEGISREDSDRIACVSNGPATVAGIRKKLGADAIETRCVEKIDRDGRIVHPGRYYLTDIGRARLAELMEARDGA